MLLQCVITLHCVQVKEKELGSKSAISDTALTQCSSEQTSHLANIFAVDSSVLASQPASSNRPSKRCSDKDQEPGHG